MRLYSSPKIFFISILLSVSVGVTSAQFNSGSTGADGALDLATINCPGGNVCYVQLPESGVLNYTTVNIPSGKGLLFTRNSRNTPVYLLAQGNIIINGLIDVSSVGQLAGPGGFHGGAANLNGGQGPNIPGSGAGAGPQSDGNRNGSWIGPLSLSPIVGGSGGSGGSQCTNVGQSPFGGGGGGAIVIASSTLVNITAPDGKVFASGGGVECPFGGAGGGSGGSIRIVANAVNINSSLFANGSGIPSSPPFNGVIRIEALQGQLNFTGAATPAAVLAPFVSSSPPIISTAGLPQLLIDSVGGFQVPAYSGTRFDTVDILLPTQTLNPVIIAVSATNIPVGTQVNVAFVNGSPGGTSTPCNLAGTLASSSCTATVSNLNRTAVTYLMATAAFTPPGSLGRSNPKGPNQVAKIRLNGVLGERSKYVFLDARGKAIDTAKLSKEFLGYFGM